MRESSSWERIRALFHAALEQPADARVAFLSSACEGDESIRREVESLLAAHGASDGFLESPAIDLDADGVAARSQLEAGDRFGNFEVIGSLGAGGMGEVYRARDAQLRRDVAIKLLPRCPGGRSAAARAVRARIADPRGAEPPAHRDDPQRRAMPTACARS